MLDKEIVKALLAPTDGTFRIENHDPAWTGTKELQELDGKQLKKRLKDYLDEQREHLIDAQEKLYADNRYSLLIILQAMDAAGKDSTIEHVMSGVNPQGCQVFSFKKPSEGELDHNFMWRCWCALPERGRIGIFNRSYYEETLVVRVQPELLKYQRLPAAPAPDTEEFWQARFEDINAFERHMSRNGTVILKFFLNVSKQEQAQRFIKRLTHPDKHWKFSADDLDKRALWADYQVAYQETIAHTSTPWAPWYVIPADNKWLMRGLVLSVICERIGSLDIDFPKVPPEQMKLFTQALKTLKAETGGTPEKKTARPRKK
jgi:PPK2 family polyphosphate:nucleotide phosphotransferase